MYFFTQEKLSKLQEEVENKKMALSDAERGKHLTKTKQLSDFYTYILAI